MKFIDFLKIYNDVPIIDSKTFPLYVEDIVNFRRQVRDWIKKGYLIPLKKGIYVFSEEYRKKNPSLLFIANYLVSPSYLSLEYALKYYDLIPEKVTVFTSITTKKTVMYKNDLGVFEYRSIKKELFFGFLKKKDGEQDFFIANPEKSILDFFYLNKNYEGNFDEFDSLRFQNMEIINIERLIDYTEVYPKRVKKIVKSFIEYIKKFEMNYRKL